MSTSVVVRWLKRKHYQYEVTFPLYMLTPAEKFCFNSILFLILSMVIMAAALYLPEHISTMMRRVQFYWAGDEGVSSPLTFGRTAAAAAAATGTESTSAGSRIEL